MTRSRSVAFVFIAAAGLVGQVASAQSPTAASATVAYEAHQYAACAIAWQAVAKSGGRTNPADAFYNAACCYAKDGKAERALAMLDAASTEGFRDAAAAAKDADLSLLHGDARWTKLLALIDERTAAFEKSLVAPALRRQLLAMMDEDQAARDAWLAALKDAGVAKARGLAVQAGDRRHSQALRAALAEYGWPSRHLVGDDGAHAAWVLAQHADLELALQKDALARMKPLVETHEVAAADYAYLYDRVAVAEHRPQLYGTQFDGAEPFPIADAAHVDERRRAIGLDTLAAYKKVIAETYGNK